MSLQGDVGFCFACGGERYIEHSLYLAKSIHRVYDNPEILVGIRSEERENIEEGVLEELRKLSKLVDIERSHKDYPISAKTATMAAASRISGKDIMISLDSDMLLIDEIEQVISKEVVEQEESWMSVRNAGYAENLDFLSKSKRKFWKDIYSEFGHEFPGFKFTTYYDGVEIPPYFSAAIVIADNNSSFAEKWNEYTSRIYEMTELRYSDQIALGILTQEFKLFECKNESMWGVPSSLEKPKDCIAVHYNEFEHFTTVNDPKLSKVLDKIGLDVSEKFPGVYTYELARLKALNFHFTLKYPLFQKFKYYLKSLIPSGVRKYLKAHI